MSGLTDTHLLAELPYFQFTKLTVAGVNCVVGRLGYTGERGFEVVINHHDKNQLWTSLVSRARPAGFAAADILRIEAGFILFTNECRISPTVGDFGFKHLADEKTVSPTLRFTGFKATTSEPPLLWQPAAPRIYSPPEGGISVTSASYSPTFREVIGLGFVNVGHTEQSAQNLEGLFRNIKLLHPPIYDQHKRISRADW